LFFPKDFHMMGDLAARTSELPTPFPLPPPSQPWYCMEPVSPGEGGARGYNTGPCLSSPGTFDAVISIWSFLCRNSFVYSTVTRFSRHFVSTCVRLVCSSPRPGGASAGVAFFGASFFRQGVDIALFPVVAVAQLRENVSSWGAFCCGTAFFSFLPCPAYGTAMGRASGRLFLYWTFLESFSARIVSSLLTRTETLSTFFFSRSTPFFVCLNTKVIFRPIPPSLTDAGGFA